MKNLYVTSGLIVLFLILSCRTQQQQTDRLPVATISRDTALIADLRLMEAEKKIEKAQLDSDAIGYFDEDFLRFDNHIYKPHINTVLFHRVGWEMSRPVIEMGKNDRLLLSFDDLEGGFKNYQYTILHCDAYWQPSHINQSEYIDGFTTDYIVDYKTSRNTLQNYTHYFLTFPGNEVRPRISGNYILKVFLDSPDNVVLTRRFKIFEARVSIDGSVRQATAIEDRDSKQEIALTITHTNFRIADPHRNLHLIVQQNQRTDNMIKSVKPSLIRNHVLEYDWGSGIVFDGNNEFRAFDLKNLRLLMEGVHNIELQQGYYHAYLKADERKPFRRYRQRHDINGKRAIKNEEAQDSRVGADYVYVHFSLAYPAPMIHGNIHIMGALTDWGFNNNSKMIYNYHTRAYEKVLLLKQGYYNYAYAFLENGKEAADMGLLEGNHSQTENDYAIYVYYRKPNELYDRLIGVKFLNSRE